KVEELKVIGRMDLDALNQRTRPGKKSRKERETERRDRRRQKAGVPVSENEQQKKPVDTPPEQETEKKEDDVIKARAGRLTGPTVVGKIELPDKKLRKQKDIAEEASQKKRRKRIRE